MLYRLLVIPLLGLLLNGCGGGGVGAESSLSSHLAPPATTQPVIPLVTVLKERSATRSTIAYAEVVAAIAENKPQQQSSYVSVTQSSDHNGYGISQSDVGFLAVDPDRLLLRIDNDGEWNIAINAAELVEIESSRLARVNQAYRFADTRETSKGMRLVTGYFVDFGPDHTDWLAAGSWVEVDADADQQRVIAASELDIGVFADGAKPFYGSLTALTGRAVWVGPVWGLYAREGSGTLSDAQGRIEMIADFSSASTTGSLRGGITQLVDEEQRQLFSGLPVELKSVRLGGSSYSGSIGNDQGTVIGNWGGRFYREEEFGRTRVPASVAGTVGFSSRSGNSPQEHFAGGYVTSLDSFSP